MTKYDIAFLTESRYIDPNPTDPYKMAVLEEDKLLSRELDERGLSSIRVDWADSSFDWSSVRFGMFRSTWDYFYRYDEFQSWLSRMEGSMAFINTLPQVRWNMDKHYLLDLESKGLSIVPTTYVEAGEKTTLEQVYKMSSAEKIIIKPAISGTARHTYLIHQENLVRHEHVFQDLIQNECMLVQPFIENIAKKGEVSFVAFEGKFSHAVLKKAREGDFRVQSDFGGTIHTYNASREEVKFVEKTIAACDTVPTYARVDIAIDDKDEMVLVELELIEPDMWLRTNPGSAEKLIEAVTRHLQNSG
ncbi:MAG: hypothetical protein JXR03_15040 [Cyclobacteriaceae bacterium]